MYKAVTALASWLIYECTDTTEQRMIPGGIYDKMLTNVDTTSFVHASVAIASGSIAALVSWLVYGCSNTMSRGWFLEAATRG